MHHRYLLFTLLTLLTTLASEADGQALQGTTQKNGVPRIVVNIMIDQLRSDYLEAFAPL